LRVGVLRREGQTGNQGQQSGYEFGHGLTLANRWPFAEIKPGCGRDAVEACA
jgi:hypothetical protein